MLVIGLASECGLDLIDISLDTTVKVKSRCKLAPTQEHTAFLSSTTA